MAINLVNSRFPFARIFILAESMQFRSSQLTRSHRTLAVIAAQPHAEKLNLKLKSNQNLTNHTKIFSELELIDKFLFQVCGIELKNVEIESESREYFAHNFELNQQKVKFRMAKITPTKTGQFVTIWKRNENGITEPHNVTDEFELYIIAIRQETKFGVFIFNKAILSENKILTNKNVEGKRGIRVYPTWSLTTSKQAEKTQNWQTKCFLEISNDNQIEITKAKKLLNIE